VEALVGGQEDVPLGLWERSVYSVGAGACVIVIGMMLLSYLPGAIQPWQVLAAFDGLSLVLAWWVWRRGATVVRLPLRPEWGIAAGLLALALVGGLMRLPNLGYSEFQGDEATALLHTVDAVQGLGDAL